MNIYFFKTYAWLSYYYYYSFVIIINAKIWSLKIDKIGMAIIFEISNTLSTRRAHNKFMGIFSTELNVETS